MAVAVVAAVLVVGVRGPRDDREPPGDGSATLSLAETGAGLRALDVPLDAAALRRSRPGVRVSRTVEASRFTMVGLTWRGAPADVRLQVRADGRWQAWRDAEMLSDGPDASSSEGTPGLVGTDLQWVGPADAVRVELTGAEPRDLTLALMGADPSVVSPVFPRSQKRTAQSKIAPRPWILSRTAWGADPKLRSGTPTINSTIRQVHIHHTVNSNDYTRQDVPGLLRGMYRYHTQNLGWSDLGYNAVVDRFGRIWDGRAGGPARAVRGAHTLGFNDTSTGVAVLGNFEVAEPTPAVIKALARYAAWKLHQFGRNPRARLTVVSTGSDRFSAGRTVRLPTSDGHRDTNETACPGELLSDKLTEIRIRTANRMARF